MYPKGQKWGYSELDLKSSFGEIGFIPPQTGNLVNLRALAGALRWEWNKFGNNRTRSNLLRTQLCQLTQFRRPNRASPQRRSLRTKIGKKKLCAPPIQNRFRFKMQNVKLKNLFAFDLLTNLWMICQIEAGHRFFLQKLQLVLYLEISNNDF